jgi:hypothetical protein
MYYLSTKNISDTSSIIPFHHATTAKTSHQQHQTATTGLKTSINPNKAAYPPCTNPSSELCPRGTYSSQYKVVEDSQRNLAAPTASAVPEEQVSLTPEREFRAVTAMSGRLRLDRSSEEMSVATKRSFAVAENGSFPIHSVHAALTSWKPGRVRLEVRRKAPAMRAVGRAETRCCAGSKKESARRYGRWAERLSLEVI